MSGAAARGAAARGAAPLGGVGTRCLAIAALTAIVDQGTKLVAAAALAGEEVALGGPLFLTLHHNGTFARGMQLGAATLPATLLLTAATLWLVARACAPLARIDRAAPWSLGLVAGASLGNAIDFVRTGLGAVDFLGLQTRDGAFVFNVADIAAYVGVVLLARSGWRIVAQLAARRTATVTVTQRPTRAAADAERAVPVFVEPDVTPLAASSVAPRTTVARETARETAPDPTRDAAQRR